MPDARRRRTSTAQTDGATTPLRETATRAEDGCLLLGAPIEREFLDESEQRVLAAVNAASDCSSSSDELAALTGWPDRYHLSHARANVLRAFDLPPESRVLEVGAGCGAITRLLGERCALVDALEPVRERAVVARARTADLANVEVVVGKVEDVPATAAYDVVVVIGVLEYAGNGSAERAPYLSFLRHLSDVLRHGGSMVLAIENRLGVKYLAGSPEDHTWRSFESVEGYRYGDNRARTFSRAALISLLEDSGLHPQVFGAFPDYKFARVVMHEELLSDRPELGWRLPAFPSAELRGERPHEVDEGALWQELVRARCAHDFCNSFVALATRHADGASLWPADRLAALYQPQRTARCAMEMRLVRDGAALQMQRRALREPYSGSSLRQVVRDEPVVQGTDMIELLQRTGGAQFEELLHRWEQLLSERVRVGAPAPIDCIPQNIVVGDDGALHVIDQEWEADGWDLDDTVARGALRTAITLAETTPAARWPGVTTVRDLVLRVGEIAGLLPSDDWVDGAVRREAALQAEILLPPPDTHGLDAASLYERGMAAQLASPLEEQRMGLRTHQQLAAARALNAEMQREIDAQRVALESLREQRDAADALAGSMLRSFSWRATRPARVAVRAARRMVR
jgi:2-polyprenyl-3-methyl-5-hydroxy-6-metoxy-1,4-benzoquinol methylase